MKTVFFALALLLTPAFRAHADDSLAAIQRVAAEIETKKGERFDLLSRAQGNGPHWHRLFTDALYKNPPPDSPFNRKNSAPYDYVFHQRRSDEDFIFDEWRQRRQAQDVRNGNYKSIAKGYEEEFREVLKLMLADYRRAIELKADEERLKAYKLWLMDQQPIPPPLIEGLSRVSELLKSGRRGEALAELKTLKPYASFWSPAALALVMA